MKSLRLAKDIGKSVFDASGISAFSLSSNKLQKTQLVTFNQMHHAVKAVPTEVQFTPFILHETQTQRIDCRKATMQDKDEIVDFVCEHFLRREPLMTVLQATAKDAKPFVDYQVKEALRHSASFVATDEKGQVCGIRLNAVGPADENEKFMDFGSKMNKLSKFLEHVEGDLLKRLRTPHIMRHIAICVNPEIARSGIATMMMQKSVDYARNNGLQYMIATCSGQIATKLALKMGFRVVRQVPYSSYVDSASHFARFPDDCLVNPAVHRPFLPVAKAHYSAKLMIKNVSPLSSSFTPDLPTLSI